jgi:hypothetical protein
LSQIITIKLTIEQINQLGIALDFASRAAAIVYQKELANGNVREVTNMGNIIQSAKELYELLTDHVAIGEPENNTEN